MSTPARCGRHATSACGRRQEQPVPPRGSSRGDRGAARGDRAAWLVGPAPRATFPRERRGPDGRLRRPLMPQDVRAIDWTSRPHRMVLRKIRAGDGHPGVLDAILATELSPFRRPPRANVGWPPVNSSRSVMARSAGPRSTAPCGSPTSSAVTRRHSGISSCRPSARWSSPASTSRLPEVGDRARRASPSRPHLARDLLRTSTPASATCTSTSTTAR